MLFRHSELILQAEIKNKANGAVTLAAPLFFLEQAAQKMRYRIVQIYLKASVVRKVMEPI